MSPLKRLLRSLNGLINRVNWLNWSVRNKTQKMREVSVVRIKSLPQIRELYSLHIIVRENEAPEHFVSPRELSANHRTVCRVRTLVL